MAFPWDSGDSSYDFQSVKVTFDSTLVDSLICQKLELLIKVRELAPCSTLLHFSATGRDPQTLVAILANFFLFAADRPRSGIASNRLVLVMFTLLACGQAVQFGKPLVLMSEDDRLLQLRDLLKVCCRDLCVAASFCCTRFRMGKCFSSRLLLGSFRQLLLLLLSAQQQPKTD